MDVISYTAARTTLKETMDKVCRNHAPVMITRQNAEPVVMMSLEDYEAIEETLYLFRSPANSVRLTRSIADIEAGRVTEREILE